MLQVTTPARARFVFPMSAKWTARGNHRPTNTLIGAHLGQREEKEKGEACNQLLEKNSPEDGGCIFPQNVSAHQQVHVPSQPRKPQSNSTSHTTQIFSKNYMSVDKARYSNG
jgi:hypothetical protein